MSTIDDLYTQLGKNCDSINVAIGKFAAQIPNANDQQHLQIRNKIHYLGGEAIEFRAAFLNAAMEIRC